jgi:hypothetical protein
MQLKKNQKAFERDRLKLSKIKIITGFYVETIFHYKTTESNDICDVLVCSAEYYASCCFIPPVIQHAEVLVFFFFWKSHNIIQNLRCNVTDLAHKLFENKRFYGFDLSS